MNLAQYRKLIESVRAGVIADLTNGPQSTESKLWLGGFMVAMKADNEWLNYRRLDADLGIESGTAHRYRAAAMTDILPERVNALGGLTKVAENPPGPQAQTYLNATGETLIGRIQGNLSRQGYNV